MLVIADSTKTHHKRWNLIAGKSIFLLAQLRISFITESSKSERVHEFLSQSSIIIVFSFLHNPSINISNNKTWRSFLWASFVSDAATLAFQSVLVAVQLERIVLQHQWTIGEDKSKSLNRQSFNPLIVSIWGSFTGDETFQGWKVLHATSLVEVFVVVMSFGIAT